MPDAGSPAPAPLPALRDRFLAAQLAGDRHEAVRVVLEEGLDRGVPAAALNRHVIGAAQREVGRRWQLNLVSVAEEHAATAIAHLALAQVFARAPRAPPLGRRVLVACAEGELHDFPARLAADELELAGFDVTFLGASVPTRSLLDYLASRPLDALLLSVTMSFHVAAAREAAAQVRSRRPELVVLLGGGAVASDPALPSRLGLPEAGELGPVELLRRELGLLEGPGASTAQRPQRSGGDAERDRF